MYLTGATAELRLLDKAERMKESPDGQWFVSVGRTCVSVWSVGKNSRLRASCQVVCSDVVAILWKKKSSGGGEDKWHHHYHVVVVSGAGSKVIFQFAPNPTEVEREDEEQFPEWLEAAHDTALTCRRPVECEWKLRFLSRIECPQYSNVTSDSLYIVTTTTTAAAASRIQINRWEEPPHDPISLLYEIQPFASPNNRTISHLSISQAADLLFLSVVYQQDKCLLICTEPLTHTVHQILAIQPSDQQKKKPIQTHFPPQHPDRLAVVWDDNTISLFHILLLHPEQPPPRVKLKIHFLYDLNFQTNKWEDKDFGPIQTIKWTRSADAFAVAFQKSGLIHYSFLTPGLKFASTLFKTSGAKPRLLDNGVKDLFWSANDTALFVLPNHLGSMKQECDAEVEAAIQEEEECDLCWRIDVELFKDVDGLCLCLSGESGKLGCWIRNHPSFVQRKSYLTREQNNDVSETQIESDSAIDGIGPAEKCGLLKGGDILIEINGQNVEQVPFDEIIRKIQEIPVDSTAKLSFLRVNYEIVFARSIEKAGRVIFKQYAPYNERLGDESILEENELLNLFDAQYVPVSLIDVEAREGLDIEEEKKELFFQEDDCIWEYAFKQQALYGDVTDYYAEEKVPSFLHFEERAKYDGWSNLQGTSKDLAQQLYVRHLLGLMNTWSPSYAINLLARKNSNGSNNKEKPALETSMVLKFYFSQFRDESQRVLVEKHNQICLINSSCVEHISLPSVYIENNCPILSVSCMNQQFAFAGTRGFCLFNNHLKKWRVFGNVHYEQQLEVERALWLTDEVLVVLLKRDPNSKDDVHTPIDNTQFDPQFLEVYPRDYLDESAKLMPSLQLPYQTTMSNPVEKYYKMEKKKLKPDHFHLYLISLTSILIYEIYLKKDGTIGIEKFGDSILSLPKCLQLKRLKQFFAFSFFSSLVKQQFHKEVEKDDKLLGPNYSSTVGWTSIFNIFSTSLDSSSTESCKGSNFSLDRVCVLDTVGILYVWNVALGEVVVLSRDVSLICPSLTKHNNESKFHEFDFHFVLYGLQGVRLWFPYFDGICGSKAISFENQLDFFFQCQDPKRVSEISTLVEKYTSFKLLLLQEYGLNYLFLQTDSFYDMNRYDGLGPFTGPISPKSVAANEADEVDNFPPNLSIGLGEGISARKWNCSLDMKIAQDPILRVVDDEVNIIGIDSKTGLLFGLKPNVYQPHDTPIFDIFVSTQPFSHNLLRCIITLSICNQKLLQSEELKDDEGLLNTLSEKQSQLCVKWRSLLAAYPLASQNCSLLLYHFIEQAFQESKSHKNQTSLFTYGECLQEALRFLQLEIPKRKEYRKWFLDLICQTGRKIEPTRLPIFVGALKQVEIGDCDTGMNKVMLSFFEECVSDKSFELAANFLLLLESSINVQSNWTSNDIGIHSANLVLACIEGKNFTIAKQVLRFAQGLHEKSRGNLPCLAADQVGKYCLNELIQSQNYIGVVSILECLPSIKLPSYRCEADLPSIGDFVHKDDRDKEIQAIRSQFCLDDGDKMLKIYKEKTRARLIVLQGAFLTSGYKSWYSIITRIIEDADAAIL